MGRSFSRPSRSPAGPHSLQCCRRYGKPHLILDALRVSEEEAANEVLRFAEAHRIAVLNVAGPRSSGWGKGEGFARKVIGGLLAALAHG